MTDLIFFFLSRIRSAHIQERIAYSIASLPPWLLTVYCSLEIRQGETFQTRIDWNEYSYGEKWLWKLAKFFVVCFYLRCWGLTLHKTWQNTKRGYVCSFNKPIETLQLCNLCTVNEHKTKEVQDQGPFNINFSLFVCVFDVYRAF